MSKEPDDVRCLVCGEEAYEVQLCRDHLDDYNDWKVRRGDDTSRNRVAEYVDTLTTDLR